MQHCCLYLKAKEMLGDDEDDWFDGNQTSFNIMQNRSTWWLNCECNMLDSAMLDDVASRYCIERNI